MTSTTDGPPSGMSIKDRLAQLQNSSGGKVPELSGPMKPLPKTSSAAGKPSIPLQANSVKQAPALKPVLPQSKSSDSSDPVSKTTSESVPGKLPHKMEPAFGPSMLRKTNVGQSDQTTPATALKAPLKPTINSSLQKSTSEFPVNASSAPFSHPKKSDGESPPSEQTSPISPSSALKPPATPFKPMGSGSAPLKKTIPELPNKPGKLSLDSTPFKTKDADITDQPSSSSPEGKENSAGNVPKHNLSVKERLQALNQNSNTADSRTLQNGIGPLSPASSKQFFKTPTTASDSKTEIRPVGINSSNFEDKKKIVGGFLHNAGPGKISKPGDRRSSDCLLRHTDGKKFRKIDKASLMTSLPPPSKPSKVDTFDLTMFVLEYATAKKKFETDLMKNGDASGGETDELYTDAESTVVAKIRQNKPLRRGPSMRVSEVPEYTEEEETQETYDDCESLKPPVEENYDDFSEGPQEIYEAVPEESNVLPPPSPIPEEKKKKKENDKEKEKEKEKEKDKDKDKPGKKKGKDDSHKKEEKEKKKREEEERKQRAKFGLDDKNEKLGDGIVINNASGWKKDLNVNKGEIVSILRMHGNPTGKWLVQNMYGKIGFVQANNIEVSTPTIRQATENATLFMTGSKEEKKSSESGTKENKISESGPEEVYEPLPDDEEEGDGEMDDIYEEL